MNETLSDIWNGKQKLTLAMIVGAGLVNFLDRSSLSIALLPVRAEMHLSATQIGWLLSAFSLAYGFAQLPAGPLLDRFGAWRIMGGGLGTWSLAQLFTGMAAGIASFLPLRILLGLGEAPFVTGSIKLVRERFPLTQRGRAVSAVNMASTLGQALAPPFLTALMLWLGWRSMFMVMGALGTLLAAVWFMVQRQASPTPDAATANPPRITWNEWIALFRKRSVWGMMLGFGGVNYTVWFYISWLPTYLQTERGVTTMRSGWLAALPFLAGSAGMYLSGALSDARIRRGHNARSVHMTNIISGMVVSAAFTLAVAHVASVGAAVTCMSSALFAIHFAGTSSWGYVHIVSRRSMVATLGSIQNFGSFLIASAAPVATGRILDWTHSFHSAFTLSACVTLAGAGFYLALVHRDSPLDTESFTFENS